MRHFVRVWICLWAILGGLSTYACAQAAERLIIPFACQVDARGVSAFPTQAQSYEIIGARDSAPFTACATDDSRRCRTIMLHRFDIDCDGERVGWPQFYAAISDVTTGRAYFDGNQLIVRVRPERSRQLRRSRFDPPPSRRAFLIEMPDGYAPVRGTVARFERDSGQRQTPMRATRNPFSSEVPPSAAQVEVKAPAKQKVAVAKPKPQAQPKPTKPNIIAVPQDDAASAANPLRAKNQPTVTKPKPTPKTENAIQPPEKEIAKKEVQKKSVQKAAGPKLKVVKAPPAKPKVSANPSSNETKATSGVVPKLLNGSKPGKEQRQSAQPVQTAPSAIETDNTETSAATIADLLEKRGAEIRAAQHSDSGASRERLETAGTPLTTGGIPSPFQVDNPPSAPTLANTMAVLGIVASLLLALSYAAFRFLTPKSTSGPARPARLTKTQIKQTPSLAFKQPTLSGMAHADPTTPPVKDNKAVPKPTTKEKSKKQQKPNELNVASSSNVSKRATPAKDGQPTEPSFDAPNQATSNLPPASDFVSPELRVPAEEIAKDQDLPHPDFNDDVNTPHANDLKPDPELPMPELVAAKLKRPDFEESALLLPKTRQDALNALGVGESAGQDVIERVVAGLRQSWRPDQSKDKAERKRRLQRMEQIETAWRILTDQSSAIEPPDQTASK